MQRYILGLDQLGYTFMNEIRIFSQAINQSTSPEVTFNIYRELMAQVMAAYHGPSDDAAFRLNCLPVWPTILYVEDSNSFFDIKREFAARVRLFALAIYDQLRTHIKEQPIGQRTYLMESVTVTLLIINVYDNVMIDAAYS